MRRSFAVVGMFPYPSGTAHLGHARLYTITDVRARHARRHGIDVLHPMGWDAFGLPAENAAIARGVDPADWTATNIARMRETFRAMGWRFEDQEIDTSSPSYYRWTQWLFLELHRQGLAVEADGWVNWCPSCRTVLADEQVVGGCWRCGTPALRERRPQWFFRITTFAQALWDGLDTLTGWDLAAIAVQRNWIGRAEGVVVDFDGLEVFTTRPDAVGDAVAVLLCPEHPLAGERRSTGALGRDVRHPLTGASIPVWVAEHVPPDYGGAVLCVPAHDEHDRAFAGAVGLPVVGSGPVGATGRPEVRFRLRDWSVGRQRRWGCPIPMVRCPVCGVVPVPLTALPVLREDPLERPCPSCGGPAVRETDTLDTFVCSSWYVFRYCDPDNQEAPFSREKVERWMPLPLYMGGIAHAAQHLLYFRFVTKALHAAGRIGFDEPVAGFVANGMVLGDDGRKMSKSGNNGVDPASVLADHPADALRLACLADVPVERDLAWEPERVAVAERFLARLDRTFATVPPVAPGDPLAWPDEEQVRRIGRAFATLDHDIRANTLHNAVARLHTLGTELRAVLATAERAPAAAAAIARDLLVALHPFVPGWVEGRWPERFGALEATAWPVYPVAAAGTRWVLQVDGRTVGTADWPPDVADAGASAAADPRVVRRLGDRPVIRTVVVPGAVVNLVTR